MKKSEIIKKFQEYLELNYISDNTINNYFSLGNKIINDKHIDTLYNLSSDYLKNYAVNYLLTKDE